MPLRVAVPQRTGGDHLGVEQGVAAEQAVKVTAMAVGPIHHGGDGCAPKRGIGKIHGAIIPRHPFQIGHNGDVPKNI
jgi:hypothetical protein